MKNMHKISAFLLMCLLLMAVVSCHGNKNDGTNPENIMDATNVELDAGPENPDPNDTVSKVVNDADRKDINSMTDSTTTDAEEASINRNKN